MKCCTPPQIGFAAAIEWDYTITQSTQSCTNLARVKVLQRDHRLHTRSTVFGRRGGQGGGPARQPALELLNLVGGEPGRQTPSVSVAAAENRRRRGEHVELIFTLDEKPPDASPVRRQKKKKKKEGTR